MNRSNWSSFPNSIAGQVIILLALAMLLFMAGFFLILHVAKDNPNAPPVVVFSERQSGVAELLSQIEADQREDTIAFLQQKYPDMRYALLPSDTPLPEGARWGPLRPFWLEGGPGMFASEGRDRRASNSSSFESELNETDDKIHHMRILVPQENNLVQVTAYFQLPDKQIFSVSKIMNVEPPPDFMLSVVFSFLVVCVTLLIIWAFLALVRPLRRLAQVTNRIAMENAEPQMAEIKGPTELRAAARALNKMQDRIHHLLEDRTRMLAAVGHDLRTPVTRLRLRADMIEQGDIKAAMLRDLGLMDGLLSRLMTYFRKGETGEELVKLELSSLIDSLASEWSDAGHDVQLVDLAPARIMARPNELLRMVDNLIDNAIKYAGACSLQLIQEDGRACLKVIDHGPGIADKNKAYLLEPFARGDEARTMNDKSGFGLGLAIAWQAALHHKAEMKLSDTDGGGLTVLIRFPLAA